MKSKTTFAWEPADGSRQYVREAVGRLRAFIVVPEGATLPMELQPYRRAILDGSAFDELDIMGTVELLRNLAARARADRAGRTMEVWEELLSAATNADEAAVLLAKQFLVGAAREVENL